jgi:hypothetical protein
MWRPEGHRALGRCRRRWDYNITMEGQVMRWRGTDWIAVAQDKDSEHGNESMSSINAWNVWTR